MDITGNPLLINAADVASVGVIVWTGNLHIWEISFSNYAAATDSCSILNLNGKVIWFGHAPLTGDAETVRSGHLGTINGGIKIGVGGITSGTVRIFIK